MKALAGFLPLAEGQVLFQGRDLCTVPVHSRVQEGVAYAPQENVVFGELSVEENLWLHLPNRNGERYQACLAAFPRLTERLQQRAGLLSGGERKLLSFARTIGLQAQVSLLDEPTEGVQPENIDRMAVLVNQSKAGGRTFVIVEQNLTFIEQVADDVIVLDHGEVVLVGAIKELSREQIERYLTV
jgi:branched-chain amino acid transport system ATP-binding protein